jgi:hypothetical protein
MLYSECVSLLLFGGVNWDMHCAMAVQQNLSIVLCDAPVQVDLPETMRSWVSHDTMQISRLHYHHQDTGVHALPFASDIYQGPLCLVMHESLKTQFAALRPAEREVLFNNALSIHQGKLREEQADLAQRIEMSSLHSKSSQVYVGRSDIIDKNQKTDCDGLFAGQNFKPSMSN